MNIQTDHHVGARIRIARMEAGRELRWLAEQLHRTVCTSSPVEWAEYYLGSVEAGEEQLVHVTELAAIAKALDCSLLYLLGVEDA